MTELIADGITARKDQERADYIAGLRGLADLLQDRSEIPTPYGSSDILILGGDAATVETMAGLFGRPVTHRMTERRDGTPVAWFTWRVHGLPVEVATDDADALGWEQVTTTTEVTRLVLPEHLTPHGGDR